MLRLIDFYFYDSLRYLGGGGSHSQTKSADTRANINNKHSIRLSTKSRSLRPQKSKTFSTGSEEGKGYEMKSQKELPSAVNQQTQFPCY